MKQLLITISALVMVGCEKAPTKQDTQLKIAVQSMDVERTKKNVRDNILGNTRRAKLRATRARRRREREEAERDDE